MKSKDNFERNTRTTWSLTLVSRVTGLVRDGALARLFGTSALASAFYFAFLIPNLFRRLFGEGALAVAFLPSYSKLRQEDPKTAYAFATLTISKLVLLLGAITLLVELALWGIISMRSEPSASLELAMVMLPYMPLVCLVAILGAMLHVHDRFGPTAAAPIILNGVMIAAIVGFVGIFDNPFNHMIVVGISVVVAGAIQIVWSLVALGGLKWRTKETSQAKDELKHMKRRMLPMIVGLATLQINTLLDGLIASWPNIFGDTIFGLQYPLGEGAMASLSWAQRLYQFPLGVFGIAVATAIYPLLTKQCKDNEAFSETLRRGLRLVVFIGLPASAGLIFVREPLAAAVFQGVEFTSEDAILVGSILLGYAPAVWAYSMTQVLTKGFYAKEDMMTPVKIAVFCVALNFVLNVFLIWTPLRTAGLAWSTAICAVIQASLLIIFIRKKVAIPVDAGVVKSWLQTSVLTLVMGSAVAGVVHQVWDPHGGWLQALWTLAAGVGTGILVFGLGSTLVKMPELHWVVGRSK